VGFNAISNTHPSLFETFGDEESLRRNAMKTSKGKDGRVEGEQEDMRPLLEAGMRAINRSESTATNLRHSSQIMEAPLLRPFSYTARLRHSSQIMEAPLLRPFSYTARLRDSSQIMEAPLLKPFSYREG
jgi:hypothetical protein